jgi:hypothetical protein
MELFSQERPVYPVSQPVLYAMYQNGLTGQQPEAESQDLTDQKQENVPVIKGKVVFADTITGIRDMNAFLSNLTSLLNSSLLKNSNPVLSNDTINNQLVYRAVDYLDIEKSSWSIFALYMKYIFLIQYQEDNCILSLRNIHYSISRR